MKKETVFCAALYIRISKEDEKLGESVSIRNQRMILEQYAKSCGWADYEIFIDEGFSGTSFDRPAFQEMLQKIKERKIQAVVVKDLSRFGRNYIQAGQYIDYIFPDCGCRFIALNDGVDTKEEENDMMPFRNLFNEWYARDTSRKIRAVKLAKAQRGERVNAVAPYGYCLKEGDKTFRLEVEEETAGVVKTIFTMYADGERVSKIKEVLQLQKKLSPKYHKWYKKGCFFPEKREDDRCFVWSEKTIYDILGRAEYLGHTINCKKHRISYKNPKEVENPPEKQLLFYNTHQALIEKELWERVQQRKRRVDKEPKSML